MYDSPRDLKTFKASDFDESFLVIDDLDLTILSNRRIIKPFGMVNRNNAKTGENIIVKKNKIIFVGSSMGAWITLNLIRKFSKQTIGFVGIGSAPEFLEKLMWKNFSKKMRRDIKKNGVINLRHGKYEYPITYQLIKDGRKNKIFNKSYLQSIKITMIHGKNDESVPIIYSKKILKLFRNAEKKLVIIKGGDHSLSKPKWLNIIKKEIKLMI